MSREILFRGKDRTGIMNNDWFYGSLDITSDPEFPVIICKDRFGNIMLIDIDKETIGQYVGRKDNNGKKIFVGDIIKVNILYDSGCYPYEKTEIIEVKFKDGNFYPFCSKILSNIQIIGNVVDNKNLLGE